jgi:hypothetical protein
MERPNLHHYLGLDPKNRATTDTVINLTLHQNWDRYKLKIDRAVREFVSEKAVT